MHEYKSVAKFLNKKKEKVNFKSFLFKQAIRILICIVLFLVGMIVLKIDKNSGNALHNFLYENNLSFAGFNTLYKKYLGGILPFDGLVKDKVKEVFNEKIKYSEASIFKDGVKLTVEKNYLVPILESGVVIFIGDKEGYGKVVIIQQVDGIDVWYGNLVNINVDLYDYVSKGEFLSEASDDHLYLLFQKKGAFLNYKDYLK